MATPARPGAARPPLRYQSFTMRFLRSLWLDRLTPAGRALLWAGILVAALANITYTLMMFFLFSLLLGMALGSLVLARLARARLEVSWELPQRASCGSLLKVPLQVRNVGRRAAVDVGLRPHRLSSLVEPVPPEGAFLPRLDPGQSVRTCWQLRLLRRGHYEMEGLRQECYFPFGLWRDAVVHRRPQRILVYPAFHPLVSLEVPVGRLYQPGGIALSSNVGDSTEFIGTREFRDGDSIRDIHWRSWARLGRPVVKEFQEEYFCRIALLLDTFLPSREEKVGRPAFEASLSLAAAMADRLGQGEYVVDLFAAGPDLYTLQAGRNLAHLDNVLDILACLDPCRQPPFQTLAPVLLENLPGITTVILVLLDWDEARQELVRLLRDQGPAVRVLVVRDRPCTLPPEAAADLAGPVTVLSSAAIARGMDHL